MSNWPTKTIGELCDVRIGRTPRRDTPKFWGGDHVWVSISDLRNDIISDSAEHVSDVAASEIMPEPIPIGTLLFSFKLTIGKTAFTGVPLYTNEAIAALVVKDEGVLDKFYLRYALSGKSHEGGASSAVLGKLLNKDKIKHLEITLPPISVQKEIIATLDAANNLKKKREEADKKMAAFAPALFYKMFGDPMKNSIGLEKLGKVAQVKSGTGFPLIHQGLLDQKYPFFKVGDMNAAANQIEMHNFQHSISEETVKKLHATIFPAGSIIFPKIGAAINTNKKRLLVKPSCVDNNVMVVIPGYAISSGYLFSLFQTKHLRDFASTGNPPSIRKTTVEDWSIPVPQIDFQNHFLSILNESSQITTKQSASRASLSKLFDAVLSLSI